MDFQRAVAEPGALLRRMNARIAHRGPDEDGFFEQAPAFLANRRLSVIDVASSHQPMASADGRYTLVYNGELYNFRGLRAELEALGRRFRTRGDTEVVLQAFEQWGEKCLERLQGMFGFAIWDSREKLLFAARDQLGVKPLHYYWDGKLFAFASELKALVENPDLPRDIDLDALSLYLESQFIPAPHTIYRAIRKLEAGHALVVREDGLRDLAYWKLDYTSKFSGTEEEAAARLEEELRASVDAMLVADVPLGAFLSGGIDSSLVSALMTQQSGGPIETFNLGFEDQLTHSEHEEAAAVARHLGSRHHTVMMKPEDVVQAFDGWIDVFDEPFGDQAALPTMLLSRLARKHVTVVLTGEGADELFAGYANYRKRVRDERFTAVLGSRFSPLRPLVKHLPELLARDRILKASGLPKAERYASIPILFDAAMHPGLLSDAFLATRKERISRIAAKFYEECNAADYLERLMYVDLRLWLPDDLLVKVDRATMASSLEARVPYLDHRFVEFVATLHPGLKQRGNVRKYLLRKVALKHLPEAIVNRAKKGFMMPVAAWLETGLRERIERSVGPQGLARRGLFRDGALARLLEQHRAGRRNHSGRLWALAVLDAWFERYAPGFSL